MIVLRHSLKHLATVSSVVIDGAVIAQMLKLGGAESFKQYADQVFLPFILGQLQHASRLDLVWDSYKADSLKATARAKRGKGVHVGVLLILHPYQELARILCR